MLLGRGTKLPATLGAAASHPEWKLLCRMAFSQVECDVGEHVSLEQLSAAIDEAMGMEAWRYIGKQGLQYPTVVVTGQLSAELRNPVLAGDQLEIRGGVIAIGKSSIQLACQVSVYRTGSTVIIGNATAVMVTFDAIKKQKVLHGLPQLSFHDTIASWNGPELGEMDLDAEPQLLCRIGLEDSNPLGIMFGGAIVRDALTTATILTERNYFDSLQLNADRKSRFTPTFMEVKFIAPGRVNSMIYGYAKILEQRKSSILVGVVLRQPQADDMNKLYTIAEGRFALCRVKPIEDDFLRFRWEKLSAM